MAPRGSRCRLRGRASNVTVCHAAANRAVREGVAVLATYAGVPHAAILPIPLPLPALVRAVRDAADRARERPVAAGQHVAAAARLGWPLRVADVLTEVCRFFFVLQCVLHSRLFC